MRHLVILPGNSAKNQAWGELMRDHYASHYDSVFMQAYSHWVSGDSSIDFETEKEKLRGHISSLEDQSKVTLLAKSAGSILAILAIYQKIINPSKCIFFGMPLDLAAKDFFKDSWEPLESLVVPSVAFHNIKDPTTSFEFTRDSLFAHAPAVRLISTKGADHWYGDLTEYDQYILDV